MAVVVDLARSEESIIANVGDAARLHARGCAYQDLRVGDYRTENPHAGYGVVRIADKSTLIVAPGAASAGQVSSVATFRSARAGLTMGKGLATTARIIFHVFMTSFPYALMSSG